MWLNQYIVKPNINGGGRRKGYLFLKYLKSMEESEKDTQNACNERIIVQLSYSSLGRVGVWEDFIEEVIFVLSLEG